MTLKEFLYNPFGLGDSSITQAQKDLISKSYEEKYRILVSKENIKLKSVFKVLNKEQYYIHLEIPSESGRGNSYDVVFFFSPTEKEENNIIQFEIKMFCNAPSFAYTFANVYDKYDIIIPFLKEKFPKEIFKKSPDIRNRFHIIMYEKYLFFGAYYLLKHSEIFQKSFLLMRSKTFSKTTLSANIRTLDVITQQYQKLEKKRKKELKKGNSEKIKQRNYSIPKESSINYINKNNSSSVHQIKKNNKIKKR